MSGRTRIQVGDAVERYLRRRDGNADAPALGVRRAWDQAYKSAGEPTGTIGPEDGQELVAAWQRSLRTEMKKICERFTKPDLFFALRAIVPQNLREWGWNSLEGIPDDATRTTMARRRIAAYAALIHGRKPGERFSIGDLGEIDGAQQERFAKAFLSLLRLSDAYAWSWGWNSEFGLGEELGISEVGFSFPDGGLREKYVLRTSLDVRKHRYFSPLGRIGEFEHEAVSVSDPFSSEGREGLGSRLALLSSSYGIPLNGNGGYGFLAWMLDPIEGFMEKLEPDLVREALGGISAELFTGFLGGVCSYAQELPSYPEILNAAHATSVMKLERSMLEGDPLIERTREILRRRGLNPSTEELLEARDRFLYLATSNGKANAEELSLRMSVGDTRYSYLLHRFGGVYLLDFFHADHWLHRPLDLLSNRMGGGSQGNAKGNRVEEAVWDYIGDSETIQLLRELKNLKVRVKGHDFNDLDCPLRVGATLVLVEAKGKLLRYFAETVDRESVRKRWEENWKYLNKIDETARLIAQRKNESRYRASMTGIKNILPVVCRPYPEWIPQTDQGYWLRQPTENDPGVPRVLTPVELKEFLEAADSASLARLPKEYLVEI